MADLAAIAVPNGFLPSGVPMGMSLLGPAFSEPLLVPLATILHRLRVSILGAGSSMPDP